MKSFAIKRTFTVSFVLTTSLFISLASCVEVNHDPADQHWSKDSTLFAKSEIDSTAIYRCDTCTFAKEYVRATRIHIQTKPCPDCPWQTSKLVERKNNLGDIPQPENPSVDLSAKKKAQVERIADTVRLKLPGETKDSNFP